MVLLDVADNWLLMEDNLMVLIFPDSGGQVENSTELSTVRVSSHVDKTDKLVADYGQLPRIDRIADC